MANYKKWNDVERQFIKDSLGSFSDQELSVRLSTMTNETISQSMVRRQRRRLGIEKPRGRRPNKKNDTEVSTEE